MVTLFDAGAAIAAVRDGTIDASFRALTIPAAELPDGVEAARVLDEPVQLLTGPQHAFADAAAVKPAELAGLWIWMPGVVPGTEWGAFYEALAHSFGLTIDTTPVYPHSLIWRRDNSHPALAAIRDHLDAARPRAPETGTWVPDWA